MVLCDIFPGDVYRAKLSGVRWFVWDEPDAWGRLQISTFYNERLRARRATVKVGTLISRYTLVQLNPAARSARGFDDCPIHEETLTRCHAEANHPEEDEEKETVAVGAAVES